VETREGVDKIGLAETIEALRAELGDVVAGAAGQEIQFPVGGVQLEFQVGVTHDAHGDGKLRFWVLELGGGASCASEAVQKVTLTLDAPIDLDGRPIKVSRPSAARP
jgi:Trypsin-co-occurring domain 2